MRNRNVAQQNHWSECGRTTSSGVADALGGATAQFHRSLNPHILMKAISRISLVCAALLTAALEPNSTSSADGTVSTQNKLSKEVILREDGKDRHWLVKSNGVIIEEHGLTAHGDLHITFEYPKGVRAPQLDAPTKDTNVESVAIMFWRDGTRMSRSPMVGQTPNGHDLLWWPSGKVFREAHFVMGTPAGVWKYYDKKGGLIGEGVFHDGKRQSGVFIGGDRCGYFFFFADYPINQQKFENGALKEKVEFLKEPIFDEK